jgi:hypothetical protein
MSSGVAPVNPMGTPFERGSPVEPYPITGSATKPFFPAVKITSHWDPTRIYARSVPTAQVALPVDFRPYAKICQEYRTTAPEQAAPEVSDDVVFPMGGEVYPPNRYLNSIDQESLLRRLDRPLGTAEANQYKPPLSGGLFHTNVIDSRTPNSRFVQELAFPMACMRNSDYDCRSEAQKEAWSRSTSLFNNATKQQKYNQPFPTKQMKMSEALLLNSTK